MMYERFYLKQPLHPGDRVVLEHEEFHHLARVLRLTPGNTFELTNGQGALAHAQLTHLGKHSAEAILLHVSQTQPPCPQITLAVALLRLKKLELVIEKGTELGANQFFLFAAERSEKEELRSSQEERLSHITIAAMKQSKRLFLPTIHFFSKLEEIPLQGLCYFGDTRTSASPLQQVLEPKILFCTGPESGFTSREVAFLEAHHVQGVTLSDSILRAETAPLAALTILRYLNH